MKLLALLILVVTYLSAVDCKEIHSIAKKYTKYPTTITAIAFTESSCGAQILGDDGNSLGIMQLQIKLCEI